MLLSSDECISQARRINVASLVRPVDNKLTRVSFALSHGVYTALPFNRRLASFDPIDLRQVVDVMTTTVCMRTSLITRSHVLWALEG